MGCKQDGFVDWYLDTGDRVVWPCATGQMLESRGLRVATTFFFAIGDTLAAVFSLCSSFNSAVPTGTCIDRTLEPLVQGGEALAVF